jgi:hypothetical protein
MTPVVVVNENGAHIITGPGGMCECGIDDHGRARSCQNIIEELVRLHGHEFFDGKTPKGNTTMNVRCKVICGAVTQDKHEDGTVYRENVSFSGVYSDDPNSENKWFCQATPCLTITQSIDNPSAFGAFVPGKEYYVDFTEATSPVELTTDSVPSPAAEAPAPAATEAPAPAPAPPQT